MIFSLELLNVCDFVRKTLELCTGMLRSLILICPYLSFFFLKFEAFESALRQGNYERS